MTATGWTGEGPDGGPPMPVTEMLLGQRERHPGDALALAMARSRGAEAREARDEAREARDPDERAANLVTRGYLPGMLSQLSQRLADTTAELETERAKIETGARRQEIAAREHAAGRIDVWAMQRMLDGDLGDAHRAEQLERRADSLRRQITEAAEAISPPRPPQLDGLEASAQRANEVFRELTRARVAELGTRQASRPERRRPFASRGAAIRSEFCVYCTREGVDDDTSYLLHSDPQYNVPVTSPEQLAQLAQAEQAEQASRCWRR